MPDPPLCRCLEPQNKRPGWRELRLHAESQDVESDASDKLLDLIDLATQDGRETFARLRLLGGLPGEAS